MVAFHGQWCLWVPLSRSGEVAAVVVRWPLVPESPRLQGLGRFELLRAACSGDHGQNWHQPFKLQYNFSTIRGDEDGGLAHVPSEGIALNHASMPQGQYMRALIENNCFDCFVDAIN